MLNEQLAALFREMAELTKLEDQNPQSFRARAYDTAARALDVLDVEADSLSQAELIKVEGLGKSSAAKIREYCETGAIDKLERLRAEYPHEFREVVRIPGIGAKTAIKLRNELGVNTLDDLKTALEAQTVRTIPGLGAKTEEKIAHSIERLGMTGKDRRVPIGEAMAEAKRIAQQLEAHPSVDRVQICGSLRRLRETVADIDVLVASADPGAVNEHATTLAAVRELLAAGDTKTSFLTASGIQVDVRVVPPESFGAAILYFTGSKAHNIALRQLALQREWTLNEYHLGTDDEDIAGESEVGIYRALGLEWVPPPMREDSGEVGEASSGALEYVTVDQIRGDLHVHTDLSGDGEESLEVMVAAASERGYEYVAITDHAEDLAINGASREQMLSQREALRALQKEYPDLVLLHGAELNIGPDGSLDYDPEFLAGYDWCVASVHSHFDLPKEEQTVRLLTAMQHPSVNAIGHPSGRMIGRRPGIEFSVGAVLEAAELSRTALEINSNLARLDASAELIRRARDRDVLFVISTDSHRSKELAYTRWGVAQAQRGWARPSQITNTWPQQAFLEWVGAVRSGSPV